MEEVQRKEGLVCVCAECGATIRVVALVDPAQHGLVSHGICPACAERLYGGIFNRKRASAAAPVAASRDPAPLSPTPPGVAPAC